MNNFVKSGDRIRTKPNGLDYELNTNMSYVLKYDSWNEYSYLVENQKLELPANYYCSEEDKNFINRVLSYYNNTSKSNIGVMLQGLKGTGKSICAKKLALDSNVPVIIVHQEYPVAKLSDFLDTIDDSLCIIFDEIEKNKRMWDTNRLLSFLDGIQHSGKRLVIFTCNSDSELSEFINDRCSRIRYKRVYSSMSEASVRELCLREIKDEKFAKVVHEFIMNTFKIRSFDNVLSFIEEVLNSDSEDLFEIVGILNIETV